MVILGELEVNMVFKRKEREKGTPTTDPMYQNEINSTSKQRQGNRTSRQQTGGGGVLSRVGAPPRPSTALLETRRRLPGAELPSMAREHRAQDAPLTRPMPFSTWWSSKVIT